MDREWELRCQAIALRTLHSAGRRLVASSPSLGERCWLLARSPACLTLPT